MKQYPSIKYDEDPLRGKYIYAFNKIDGQNIRAEWRRDKGFNKFGTRRRLLRPEEPIVNQAPDLITNKYEKPLSERFGDLRYDKVTCFFEFYGPNSRDGVHETEDDHDVILFDIWPQSEGGLLNPNDFLDIAKGLDYPDILYQGRGSIDELNEAVKEGSLVGLGKEGLVCKASTPNDTKHPLMYKIKRESWKED